MSARGWSSRAPEVLQPSNPTHEEPRQNGGPQLLAEGGRKRGCAPLKPCKKRRYFDMTKIRHVTLNHICAHDIGAVLLQPNAECMRIAST